MRHISRLAIISLGLLALLACGPAGHAYTTFVIHNDSAVDLEMVWFDGEHGPEVIAADGERFDVSGGQCTKSCDDLSPGVIMCAAMAPEARIPAGESMDLGWAGQRIEPSTNLYGESCLLHQQLPEDSYEVRICLREITDSHDAPFHCQQQGFELRAEEDWEAAQRIELRFDDNDLN